MILTINAGSSSIKFAVFTAGVSPRRIMSGQVERIGNPDAQLVAGRADSPDEDRQSIDAQTHRKAAQTIAEYVRGHMGDGEITAIAHRVVHGGLALLEHRVITADVMNQLRQAQVLDMSHMPREIALIEAFGNLFPKLLQAACFDTAFFRDLPLISQLLPIPRELSDAGVRRFGFHGLSYTFLMDELTRVAGATAANGRVILAHLGSGASMAAVHHGNPIDTTMSFTPTAGLVMGTRPGDLDPGLLVYLMRDKKMSPDDIEKFLSSKCGLLGVSQISGDMRDLIKVRANDPRAAQAVDLFCYSAKKYLAAFAGALGGVETIVFSGGIGEHLAEVRAAICENLDFAGVKVDPERNRACKDIISPDASSVTIRVIPTDEEIVMARIVHPMLLGGGIAS